MTGSPQHRWLAAVVGLALAALMCAGCRPIQVNGSGDNSQSTSSSDGSGGHVDKSSYQITQPVGEISMDGDAGDVHLVAGDGPVSVTETARYSDDKPPTGHTVDGGTLTLTEGECRHERSVNGRCQVDWEIHAPAGTNLTLHGGAGDFTVTGFSGTVSAEVGSGEVRGERLTSRSVTAKAGSGGIDLGFAGPPDQVKATSSAGGVDIELPGGIGYDVDARSSTGDPDVNVTQDDNSPHKVDARTGAGSIEINNG